jgi:hypothetical protein
MLGTHSLCDPAAFLIEQALKVSPTAAKKKAG